MIAKSKLEKINALLILEPAFCESGVVALAFAGREYARLNWWWVQSLTDFECKLHCICLEMT